MYEYIVLNTEDNVWRMKITAHWNNAIVALNYCILNPFKQIKYCFIFPSIKNTERSKCTE